MPNVEQQVKLDFKDVLLRPKRSKLRSRADVDLVVEFCFINSKQQYKGVPLMASNMDTVGTFEMASAMTEQGCFTCIHKFYSLEEWKAFALAKPDVLQHLAVSMGTSDDDTKKTSSILDQIPEVRFICIDVANGYSEHFIDCVKKTRESFPEHTIIAGNVVTYEMTEALILAGADVVKVGIGPGSVCTTRLKTGVGYPQISAVMECADAAHGLGGRIISDGGCTCSGDVAKAFGAGADFVMMGGMLAGHDQSGGDLIEGSDGVKRKLFYGMSSETAMQKHSGGVAEYRATEGKTVGLPYRGDVRDTLLDILGGIRSACTYIGAAKLKEVSKRTTFVRVTMQNNSVYT